MNEQIRALALQAGYGARWTTTEQFEQFVDKLAELIVGECIDTLEFHGFDDAIPYIKWMATNKLGQHFGVEE